MSRNRAKLFACSRRNRRDVCRRAGRVNANSEKIVRRPYTIPPLVLRKSRTFLGEGFVGSEGPVTKRTDCADFCAKRVRMVRSGALLRKAAIRNQSAGLTARLIKNFPIARRILGKRRFRCLRTTCPLLGVRRVTRRRERLTLRRSKMLLRCRGYSAEPQRYRDDTRRISVLITRGSPFLINAVKERRRRR